MKSTGMYSFTLCAALSVTTGATDGEGISPDEIKQFHSARR